MPKSTPLEAGIHQSESSGWGKLNGTNLNRRFQKKTDRQNAVFFMECDSQSLLRKLVDILLSLVSQANFEFTENGIVITSMDSSQTAMIDFSIQSASFSTWELKRPIKVGMDLATVKDIL